MADVSDGPGVVVTRPGHRCRVAVERQALVQHDAEDFQLVGHRQIDAGDGHMVTGDVVACS